MTDCQLITMREYSIGGHGLKANLREAFARLIDLYFTLPEV